LRFAGGKIISSSSELKAAPVSVIEQRGIEINNDMKKMLLFMPAAIHSNFDVLY
jgi:hypothetical protein